VGRDIHTKFTKDGKCLGIVPVFRARISQAGAGMTENTEKFISTSIENTIVL